MKALVTGASGFIGSHLAEALRDRGAEVRVLVRCPERQRWAEEMEGVERCFGTLEDPEALARAVRGVDRIYHTAGVITAHSEADYLRVNAKGTEILLETAGKEAPDLERFLLVSSLAAVGPSTPDRVLNEDAPARPITPYGRSKRKGEEIALAWRDRLPVTIIRPPAVYGPRDAGVLIYFLLASRGIIPIPGFGRRVLSLVYADDLVQGILLAGEHPEAVGRTFFITTGDYEWPRVAKAIRSAVGRGVIFRVPLTLLFAAALICDGISRVMGKPMMLNGHKARELSQRAWLCSSTRARESLGFAPTSTLEPSMAVTAAWYRKAGWIKG